MEEEEEEPFIDHDMPVVHSVDHRGDMRPNFDTPPMRHLIPIVREIIAEIRTTLNNNHSEDADGDSPVQDDTEAEVRDLIFGIPTVHPLIAVLKHVLSVMDEQLEDSDEDSEPQFIRWNTRRLHIIDVSPDHPLLPTAHEIIELFHGRLYGEDDDEDEFQDGDNEEGDDEFQDDDDNNEEGNEFQDGDGNNEEGDDDGTIDDTINLISRDSGDPAGPDMESS